jgi:hypothetical protein
VHQMRALVATGVRQEGGSIRCVVWNDSGTHSACYPQPDVLHSACSIDNRKIALLDAHMALVDDERLLKWRLNHPCLLHVDVRDVRRAVDQCKGKPKHLLCPSEVPVGFRICVDGTHCAVPAREHLCEEILADHCRGISNLQNVTVRNTEGWHHADGAKVRSQV